MTPDERPNWGCHEKVPAKEAQQRRFLASKHNKLHPPRTFVSETVFLRVREVGPTICAMFWSRICGSCACNSNSLTHSPGEVSIFQAQNGDLGVFLMVPLFGAFQGSTILGGPKIDTHPFWIALPKAKRTMVCFRGLPVPTDRSPFFKSVQKVIVFPLFPMVGFSGNHAFLAWIPNCQHPLITKR